MSPKPLTIHDELARDGYSQEEKYFYEVNRELIERRRKLLDSERERSRASPGAGECRMHCPNCGDSLKAGLQLGIRVNQCPSCQGVFMDAGELQTLSEARRPRTFLNRLKQRLFPREEPAPGLF